jgi:prolyl 4-hydroxylase
MKTRCPPLEDAVPVLRPGDLNKMFERIVSTAGPGNNNNTLSDEDDNKKAQWKENGMTEYSVVVLSRPSDGPATELMTSPSKNNNINNNNDRSLPPWVIQFEDFLTPEECDAMIQLGYKAGYKRSTDFGTQKLDGTVDSKKSHGRTSENAWCSSRNNGCREDEVADRIHNRMSKVMNIPPENSEDIQLLRYEVGQFYNTHHVSVSGDVGSWQVLSDMF